jgi:hypothetical protein
MHYPEALGDLSYASYRMRFRLAAGDTGFNNALQALRSGGVASSGGYLHLYGCKVEGSWAWDINQSVLTIVTHTAETGRVVRYEYKTAMLQFFDRCREILAPYTKEILS